MITPQEIKKISRERHLPLELIEKDYVLGWILFGIVSSSISGQLAFKGGTALSKIYFTRRWRLSEDLDFTILDHNSNIQFLVDALSKEVPSIVTKYSNIDIIIKDKPFTNPNYLQGKFQYQGPISKNTVKIEISKEMFLGKIVTRSTPLAFDYPKFKVKVYSLENILSEKLRSILERGKIRDYYDVWLLLRRKKFNKQEINNLFKQKCSTKGVKFLNITQFFPQDLVNKLKPYEKTGLTRLSIEPIPTLDLMIKELKKDLSELLN